jgi:hypothetical protein
MIKKSIAQNKRQKTFPWYVSPRNNEHWKQRFGNYSCLTSSSNSTSSFFEKFDFALHAPTMLKGLEHPTLESTGQFLFTKIIWSRWLVSKQHFRNALRILAMEKIHFVSIWLVGIPRICWANTPITRYLCSWMHHQDIVHL